ILRPWDHNRTNSVRRRAMVAITHFRTAPKLLGQWAISPSVQGLIALAKCMCPIRYHGGSAKGAEGTAPNSLGAESRSSSRAVWRSVSDFRVSVISELLAEHP